MKPLLSALISSVAAACCCPLSSWAQAAEPSPRDLRDAQCVAALDTHTRELALQVKAGNEALRTPLQNQLVAGAAFVGDAYMNGNRDQKQARELSDQAQEAQKHIPAAELQALQTACAAEGTQLFAHSNGLQQTVMKRLARNRMEKLLR